MADSSDSEIELSDSPHFVRVKYSSPAAPRAVIEEDVRTLLQGAEDSCGVSKVTLMTSVYTLPYGRLRHLLLITLESADYVTELRGALKARKYPKLVLSLKQSFPQPLEFERDSYPSERIDLLEVAASPRPRPRWSIQETIVTIHDELAERDDDLAHAYGRAHYLSLLSNRDRRDQCLRYINMLVHHLYDNGLWLDSIDDAVMSLEWVGRLEQDFGTTLDNRRPVQLDTPFHRRVREHFTARTLKQAKKYWEDDFKTFLMWNGVRRELIVDTVVEGLDLMTVALAHRGPIYPLLAMADHVDALDAEEVERVEREVLGEGWAQIDEDGEFIVDEDRFQAVLAANREDSRLSVGGHLSVLN